MPTCNFIPNKLGGAVLVTSDRLHLRRYAARSRF
jgi:hypothetical protein